jgi:hypothetical protein
MVSDTRRFATWAILVLSIIAMLSVAVFKGFWLLMGTLALDSGPMPRIYVINLVQAPAYLASALTAWKWPWVAECVAALTFIAIVTKLIPPPTPPYQRYLSWEFAFIVAANLAFFAVMSLRRIKMKSV